MRKVGILVIVCLLAVTGMMAAMAYNNATVTNAATMKVVNTNTSLLSLNVDNNRIGNKDVTAFIDSTGRLNFDFAIGKGNHESGWQPKQWGFQPGSKYTWNKLFKITNNSNEPVEYTIENNGLKYITVKVVEIAGAGVDLTLVEDGNNLNKAAGMAGGDTAWIKVSFDIPEEAEIEDIEGTLTVKSRAVENAWRHGLVDW